MEMLVATLIGTAAVAVVLYPIVRPARPRADAGLDSAVPTPVGAAEPGTRPETDAWTVGSRAPLEVEVAYYRRAVRAQTACRRCGLANPPGSRFCAECGGVLGAGKDRVRRR